jgi:hypothetical protein
MDLIMEIRFGSHLYGTATPQSDFDFKGVYIPDAREILLQRVRDNISISPEKAAGVRNNAGDIDREFFSLQRYMNLLAEGQTMALDMLFAPDTAMTVAPVPIWREIQRNAHRLVTRRPSAFLRYCRQQANKYGIKGRRIAVARQMLAVLTTAEAAFGTTARLGTIEPELSAFASAHVTFIDVPTPGGHIVRHLELCGKKMPFTSSIKTAREIAQRLVDEYGQRALQAEQNQGVDWKALSHAVRVGREALELFTTGRIHFPLSCAAELLAIKRGELSYETVAETIEQLLVRVEAAADASSLPEAPDQDFIDDLVARAYRDKIMGAN